ncbi:MAG: DUF2939 domain-containing protein [Candidatus Atribacteria bacterium]|nr:DUF2939 domain-containing protein [Candidatus Atribacteria bacterium]
MKKRLLFLLFFIIVISLFISWRVIVSPQYSLKQLKKAIANNDTVTFDKYVDLDRTVEAAIDQIWQYYSNPVADSRKNPWFDIRNEIGSTLLSVVKPNLKEIIKKEIHSYTSQGKWEDAISQDENRLVSVFVKKVKEIVNPDDWEFQSINYIEIENDVASLGLTYYDRTKQSNFIVEVKMRKMSGYWQIIEITNVNQLLNIFLNITNV